MLSPVSRRAKVARFLAVGLCLILASQQPEFLEECSAFLPNIAEILLSK